jgi:hypothetical protein
MTLSITIKPDTHHQATQGTQHNDTHNDSKNRTLTLRTVMTLSTMSLSITVQQHNNPQHHNSAYRHKTVSTVMLIVSMLKAVMLNVVALACRQFFYNTSRIFNVTLILFSTTEKVFFEQNHF